MRKFPGSLLALAVVLLALLAPYITPAFAQSDLDRQAREIGLDLRCPVCQNLSVADSPSPLAAEMRSVIRQKLVAGESREAIMQYFVERYGQSVLLNPPKQGFTLLVWLGAVVAVTGGAALLAMRVRRSLLGNVSGVNIPGVVDVPANSALTPDESARYEAALDAELASYKGEAG